MTGRFLAQQIEMKFRLRTLFGFTTLVAVVLAIPMYLHNTVIPENRLIASQLANELGSTFEQNGVFPQKPTLFKSDIGEQLDLPLFATSTGELTNRWGQSIQVEPVLLDGVGNSLFLELTVISRGPFGIF